MEKYVFRDTDISGHEEYDIRGAEYAQLIQVCCRYSSTLSLIITKPDTEIVQKLGAFEISKPEQVSFVYSHYGRDFPVGERFYRVCSELCELLIQLVGGIFEWIDGWGFQNPSDPVFYRENGSAFFTSTIHDGICELMPQTGENIASVIENPLWIKVDSNVVGWPCNSYKVITPVDQKTGNRQINTGDDSV